jgi:hypothetical protein
MVWNNPTGFSSEFLANHHPILLQETFNRIKAFLLYPPTCACTSLCHCQEKREQVILSLNTDLYNSIEETREHLDLYALRLFLKIPEDSVFRKCHGDAYPLWLIHEGFMKKHKAQHFKSVDQLVWTLLKLGHANSSPIFGLQTSLRRAIEELLGPLPLKKKREESLKTEQICGEKAYIGRFHTYKSVCHFIIAYRILKEELGHETWTEDFFFLQKPEHIERFLQISYALREDFLSLRTNNAKEKFLFSEDLLLPLPSWINDESIEALSNPLEEAAQVG